MLYFSIAGQMIASDDGSGLQYFLTDHLGSMVGVMDAGGALVSQQRYLPFGQVRASLGTITQTDFGYTGQRKEGYTGLMDYKARFYDGSLGRFLQPDSIVPGVGNPQNFNRFSYVGNSPVNRIDPSGHYDCGTQYYTGCMDDPNSAFGSGAQSGNVPCTGYEVCLKSGKPRQIDNTHVKLIGEPPILSGASVGSNNKGIVIPINSKKIAQDILAYLGLSPDEAKKKAIALDKSALILDVGLQAYVLSWTAGGAILGSGAGGVGAIPSAAAGWWKSQTQVLPILNVGNGIALTATGFSVLADFATGESNLNGVLVVNQGINLRADVNLSANTQTSTILTGIGLVALTTELSTITQSAAVANDVGSFPNWFNDYHNYISWP